MTKYKLVQFIKRLFCSHTNNVFKRNIYGDEIIFLNARSVYRCVDCGGYVYKQTLGNENE